MTQCVAAEMTKYQFRDGWHYYNYIILTCVLLVLPCPFLLIIYSPEKREEECERDCNHFFIANNILWKATNWRPIYHKTTQHYLLLSISLSEYWKMTFSLSLSLWVGAFVLVFAFARFGSIQYIWRPDMEFAFCRWGALFFLAFFWTFAFHNLWLHRGSILPFSTLFIYIW